MALITTPGSEFADSYATLAELDEYNNDRLHSSTWSAAVEATKEAAARWATLLLDANPRAWTGAAVDAVQALGWPRSGMLTRNGFEIPTSGADSIPRDLKRAQAEFARQLIASDRTTDNAIVNQGITKLKAGSVELSFADLNTENSLLVARSIREMNALAAVLPDAVKFLLVPSWLLPDAEDARNASTFLFEVL